MSRQSRHLCLLMLLCATRVWAEPPYRVLPQDFNADKSQQMMRSYLRQQVHSALDARRIELDAALESVELFRQYQSERRSFLRVVFGASHNSSDRQRVAPKAVVMGRIVSDQFSIEKLLIELRPGFHLTANLYRPHGVGPFPAVLHPVGHSENGKAAGDYQRANQLLASYGFIVLCYDPIGQGERKQLTSSKGVPIFKASSEHQQLGPGPILLGTDLGAYMVWDGVRALDYLSGRPDVTANRIGCTGNSGGGNMTSYLMAFDPRISAAAPGCFVTTHRRKNGRPGPGDAEQNLHGQIAARFDHPDFILTRAPKPTLILAATDDFVPIDGAWDAFRQAKRAYGLLGYPERIQLTEAAAKHGFSRRLRESATTFFCRWLQDRHVVVDESKLPAPHIYSDEELRATATGQVLSNSRENSLLDWMEEQGKELLKSRRVPLTRSIVREVAQVRELEEIPLSKAIFPEGESERPIKLVLNPEPLIHLPALYWPRPSNGSERSAEESPVLLVPSGGMNTAVSEAMELHATGRSVLVLEVRDTGETQTNNWRFFGADYYIAHMLNRSWLGMRAEDILTSARWLQQISKSTSIELISDGEVASAALHAAFLEPKVFSRLKVTGGITSWQSLISTPRAQPHIHECIHDVLKHYDLPDLRSNLGNKLDWHLQ